MLYEKFHLVVQVYMIINEKKYSVRKCVYYFLYFRYERFRHYVYQSSHYSHIKVYNFSTHNFIPHLVDLCLPKFPYLIVTPYLFFLRPFDN